MAAEVESQVLELGVDLKSAIADMAKWQRATVALLEKVTHSSEQLGKTVKKVNKQSFASNEDVKDSVKDLAGAYHKETVEVLKLGNAIDQLEAQAAQADETRKKALQEQIELLKEEREEKVKSLKSKGDTYNAFKKDAVEARDAFKDVFKDFFAKDFKKSLVGIPKALAKAFKLAPGAGHRLKELGSRMAGNGAEKGGAQGAAMKGLGNVMKGMGSLMGSLKPVIDAISKLGPALSMVGGAVMGIVKLFLDLDAQAKDFNKSILQSAGTAEFLSQAGGDADLAYDKLHTTLRGVRDAAYELDNIQWGIMPDDYKAMLNTLNQEGVSLRTIGLEAERSGKSVQEFTSELAHVSVAYSRAFGVPIQQINELQAEMMTEMGIGLDQTKLSFQQMTRSADEAGMSGNKFFAMIRSVSQDLSLWGTRMEDAVKLLGRLGQVMNPRNAQKFMQTATQGLKNMGRTERLRLTLLTGQGKMGKLVERDTKRKAAGIAKSLGMTTEDLISKMNKEGPAGLENAIQSLPKEMQGATREALQDMNLQQKRSKKGVFGLSGAARTMGPLGAMEALKDAITRFSGGGPNRKLVDSAGEIGTEMMAENLGVSEEQLDQMIKLESSLDTQREVLKNQLASGNAEQQAAAREALKKAGITAKTDEELRKSIDGAGYDEIMDTMSEGDKMLAEGASKQEVFAKQQADLQTSMLQKMEMMLNFIMNQIYDALIDIWDAITSLTVFGGDQKERDLKRAMYRNKDPNVSKAYQEAGGDAYKLRGNVIGKGGLGAALDKALNDFKNAKTDDEKTSTGANLQNFTRRIDESFKDADKIHELFNSMGMKGAEAFKVIQAMEKSGKSFGASLDDAGLTSEQQAEVLRKSLWFMDPAAVAQMSHLAGDGPATASAAPSSQATSAAKSAATGQPGGGMAAVATPAAAATQASVATRTADDNLSTSKEQLSTLTSIDNQIDKMKMDTGFLSGPYSKAIETSMLAALRTALFEYYMYKDIDQGEMAQMMQSSGMSGRAVAQAMGEGALGGMVAEDTMNAITLKGHATGGMVTGVSNGLAQVTAAAGEGLASIGKGERIVPRGGGGGASTPVNLNFEGMQTSDFANFIKGRVNDAIYEYKRRERFM